MNKYVILLLLKMRCLNEANTICLLIQIKLIFFFLWVAVSSRVSFPKHKFIIGYWRN